MPWAMTAMRCWPSSPTCWNATSTRKKRPAMPDQLTGVGVGVGIAIGPIYKMGRPPELPPERQIVDGKSEVEAASRALTAVSADLAARSLEVKDPTASAVLDALSL